MFDVAVIGGGVTGAFVARECTRLGLKVVVLEAGADVASGASRANSGIVHAGFDAPAGSKKARFNVEGNRLMEETCRELGVKFRRNGSLVLALDETQLPTLTELYERGRENGVPQLRILTAAETKEKEPNVIGTVAGALYAPTGGIVCPYGLTIAAMGNAMDNGAALYTDFAVTGVSKDADSRVLHAADGRSVQAKYVVNCAGAGSGKIAALFGDTSFTVHARKGEYILLDHAYFTDCTLFSVPTAAGKGVLVTPTADGNILLGPTSVEEDDFDNSIRREGFAEILGKAKKMCSTMPSAETITSFAGVRSYCDRHDFVIEPSAAADDLYNVAGIESPGLTSAPAIGRYVAMYIADRFGTRERVDFNPVRRPESFFKDMTAAEKNAVIEKHPEFGRIVCRCESVTLGEILHAVRANPPAKTLDGIKLRTRAGMGRCQSGFCQPTVLDILRDEYGLRFDEVTKNGGKSYVITGGEK